MRNAAFIIISCGLLVACEQQDTREADAAAITAAYNEWAKAGNDKDLEKWVSFLGPEVVFQPPARSPMTDQDEIISMYLANWEDPNYSITCEQLGVEVAGSGDMAWSHGGCTSTVTGANGGIEHIRGRWSKVWIKQPDGTWKNRLNSFGPAHILPQQPLSTERRAEIAQEVEQTVRDYYDAFTSFDKEKTEFFWGDFDDFIHAGDGRVFGDREKWLQWIQDNEPDKYISWNHSDVHVAVLAENAASLTLNFEITSVKDGEEASGTASWTYVMRKTNQGWRVVQSNGAHNSFSYYD